MTGMLATRSVFDIVHSFAFCLLLRSYHSHFSGFIVANYAIYLKEHPKKAKGEEEHKSSSKKTHYKSRDNHMSVALEENRDIPLPLVLDPCRRAVNCLTLSGKNIPLKIMKSAFVKPSAAHMRQQQELAKRGSK